jgi:hypothetical protein
MTSTLVTPEGTTKVPSPAVVYVQDSSPAEADSTPLTPHGDGSATAEPASANPDTANKPAVAATPTAGGRATKNRRNAR